MIEERTIPKEDCGRNREALESFTSVWMKRGYEFRRELVRAKADFSRIGGGSRFLVQEKICLEDSLLLANFSTALTLLKLHFPSLKGKRLLQLGCNYGCFLDYLTQRENMDCVGLDSNRIASYWEHQHYLDVRVGDARDLSQFGQEFDIVLAHHFLDEIYFLGGQITEYLQSLGENQPSSPPQQPFKMFDFSKPNDDIRKIIDAAFGVLKEGGAFLAIQADFDEELLTETRFGAVLTYHKMGEKNYVFLRGAGVKMNS
ncbi:class I SAM-dependent methyltransferase [Candidatus Woesearchaeota archaeon]|nr:class I SAM-dependent methyltransferase [Candidatus Woesearchaeota archaeon]